MKRKDGDKDDGGPQSVFNAMDAMLKDSLERLKKIRSVILDWNLPQIASENDNQAEFLATYTFFFTFWMAHKIGLLTTNVISNFSISVWAEKAMCPPLVLV